MYHENVQEASERNWSALDTTLDVGAQPLETLIESITAGRARRLWHTISNVSGGDAGHPRT